MELVEGGDLWSYLKAKERPMCTQCFINSPTLL